MYQLTKNLFIALSSCYIYFVLDDYSTAEKKCKRAEYSSDVNSDRSKQNETESDRNKRRIIKKTFGSSFDEDNLSSSDDNNNLPTKLPTPPHLTNGSYACIYLLHYINFVKN